ncbi:MAG: hypothetical protein RLZZ21_2029 [Planctomycetota bacterium]
MPQEPAYAAERSQDGGAKAASERAEGRMPVASVRRRGMGNPDLRESRPRERPATGHWATPTCQNRRAENFFAPAAPFSRFKR